MQAPSNCMTIFSCIQVGIEYLNAMQGLNDGMGQEDGKSTLYIKYLIQKFYVNDEETSHVYIIIWVKCYIFFLQLRYGPWSSDQKKKKVLGCGIAFGGYMDHGALTKKQSSQIRNCLWGLCSKKYLTLRAWQKHKKDIWNSWVMTAKPHQFYIIILQGGMHLWLKTWKKERERKKETLLSIDPSI